MNKHFCEEWKTKVLQGYKGFLQGFKVHVIKRLSPHIYKVHVNNAKVNMSLNCYLEFPLMDNKLK